jgi:hypothetical protein
MPSPLIIMPFKLEEVDIDADFTELIVCEWEAYENPYQPSFRLWCPILGTGPNARAEALEEGVKRQRDWHRSEPSSYWQKVTDTESGRIVAGALWKVYQTDSLEVPEDHEPYWYPDGSQRDFVKKALEQLNAPRAQYARRSYLCMS